MREAPLNTRTHNLDPEQREAQTMPNLDKGRTHAQTPLVKNLTPSTVKAQAIQVRSRSSPTLVKQLPSLANKHRWKQPDHPSTQNVQLKETGVLQTPISSLRYPFVDETARTSWSLVEILAQLLSGLRGQMMPPTILAHWQ